MEHIKNIEIKNFKSIRHAKIEDCRRINVFVGYPNVGKSNLLEALSLFTDFSDVNLKDFIRVEEDLNIFFNNNIRDNIEVAVNSVHRVLGKYENAQFKLLYSCADTQKGVVEFAKFYFSDNFSKRETWVEVNRGEVVQLPMRKYEFNKYSKKIGRGYEQLNIPYGENLFDVLRGNELLKEEISNLYKLYNLFLLEKSGAHLLEKSGVQTYSVMKLLGSTFVEIPYSLTSDTLQRLIFYTTAIYSNRDSILLFEEPEAHMFPPYISKLTTDIIYDKQDNQYFIATHSPFVLNDFMEHAEKKDLSIYTVGYKKDTGETVLNKLTEAEINEIYQYGVDLFFNLKDYLKDSVA